MRGAVAAGHPLTAQAGARVLEEGGNAVDACVAAAFAAGVSESFLTSPGAGGFMLVHRAQRPDGAARRLLRRRAGARVSRGAEAGEMDAVDVGFGDSETTQPFLIGPASVAVPGRSRGSRRCTGATGACRGASCSTPAIELARAGVELTRPQAHIHAILDPILRSGDEGPPDLQRRPTARGSSPATCCGSRSSPRRSRRSRAAAPPRSTAASGRARWSRRCGTAAASSRSTTSSSYRVVWRRPARVVFARPRGALEPAALVGRRPDRLRPRAARAAARGARRGAPRPSPTLAEVMREQGRARGGGFDARPPPRRARRAAALSGVAPARRSGGSSGAWPASAELAPPGGTTHISVLDADGQRRRALDARPARAPASSCPARGST